MLNVTYMTVYSASTVPLVMDPNGGDAFGGEGSEPLPAQILCFSESSLNSFLINCEQTLPVKLQVCEW